MTHIFFPFEWGLSFIRLSLSLSLVRFKWVSDLCKKCFWFLTDTSSSKSPWFPVFEDYVLMVKAQLTMIFGLTNHKKFEYHIKSFLIICFSIYHIKSVCLHTTSHSYKILYLKKESYSMILSLKPKFCKSVWLHQRLQMCSYVCVYLYMDQKVAIYWEMQSYIHQDRHRHAHTHTSLTNRAGCNVFSHISPIVVMCLVIYRDKDTCAWKVS